jgi:hypothetical protein
VEHNTVLPTPIFHYLITRMYCSKYRYSRDNMGNNETFYNWNVKCVFTAWLHVLLLQLTNTHHFHNVLLNIKHHC